ncbi:MAG: histidine kinase [Oscillospiraceae bacterium]
MSVIVALCMFLSKRPRGRSDHIYLSCLACNAGVLLFDVLALFFRGHPGAFCWWGVRISNYLAFSFGAGLLISFSYYLTEFLGAREQVSRRPLRIIRVVSVLYLLLIVLTQFYPIVYFIDPQNVYHRADLFWLSQIAGIVGLLLNGFLLIRHRRCLRRHEVAALWSYILLPTAAMCVQIFVYGLSLLNLANTICILVIFLFLQAEQGRLSAQQESQLAQSRMAILLSQIQPHFLYNTLTAICGLCDENPKEAKKVTAEFADYLRHNLDSLTQSKPVPFEDELKHTKVYLGIEQKRFEERLRVVYDIEMADFCIPALTLQPLVENAVKHGIVKRKNGGTVTISTRERASCYEIIVTDDGVGFDPSVPPDASNSHIGIQNVCDRLWSMCRGTLAIESEIGKGTAATIKIPKGDADA